MEMLAECRRKDLRGLYRTVEYGLDEDYLWLTSIAIWETQETMERGASEMEHPSTFLTEGATAKGGRMPFNDLDKEMKFRRESDVEIGEFANHAYSGYGASRMSVF
jgi:hypothetical protein